MRHSFSPSLYGVFIFFLFSDDFSVDGLRSIIDSSEGVCVVVDLGIGTEVVLKCDCDVVFLMGVIVDEVLETELVNGGG